MYPGFIVRLRPAGPWRIGPASGARNNVDHIFHSDSLYSALTSAIAQIDWLEEWIMATADAEGEPAVRFTSCFPYQRDVLFVPPPRTLWPPHGAGKVRWQGARFVPVRMIERLAAEQPMDEDRFIVDGATGCVLPSDRPQGPFRTAVRSAAAVDRLTGHTRVHTTACLEFAPDSGLWCAVSFSGDEARDRWDAPLRGAFRLLADSGFGGERSQGWGRAELPAITEGTLPGMIYSPAAEPAAGDQAWWLLGVFAPSPDEAVDWGRGNYTVATRSGRVESAAGWGTLKLSSRLIEEGSVLMSAAPPRGAAVNVAPEGFPHPVYRYGFPVSIPIAPRGGVA